MIRVVVFNGLFFVTLFLVSLVFVLLMFLPAAWLCAIPRAFARWMLFLQRTVLGQHVAIAGTPLIPNDGLLVACQHQSAWETLALWAYVPRPVFVLKRELTWIPLFGWALLRLGMIAIDRSKGAEALKTMTEGARKAMAAGHQVVIFPEGTRRGVAEPIEIKAGVLLLQRALRCPTVIISHDAGRVWPRRGFWKSAGIIHFTVHPVLPAAVSGRKLEAALEEAYGAALQLSDQGGEGQQYTGK